MSKEDNFTNCKQRFKAIEGFLRRVAFNLGNSPSQTEVKIISCIPIDVTDLQQKILCLEKELEQVKKTKTSTKKSRSLQIQPIICDTTDSTRKARRDENPCKPEPEVTRREFCTNNLDRTFFNFPDTSNVQQIPPFSFVCPTESKQNCTFYNTESLSNSTNTEKDCKPDDCRKNFFKKRKKSPKNTPRNKKQQQVVYCAQTLTKSPFNSLSFSDDVSSKNLPHEDNKNRPLSRSYLINNNMVKKQYVPPPPPQPVLNGFSNLSDISTPICRDEIPTCSKYSPYESEACSCCHGQFQNVDNYMTKRNNFRIYSTCEDFQNFNKNTYYDSNHYDIVPVKEKAVKIKKEVIIPKRKEPKRATAAKRFLDKPKPKYRCPPAMINYCNIKPLREHDVKNYPPKLHAKKDFVLNKMETMRVDPPERVRKSSKICCVDFGPVYKKQVIKDNQKVLSTINKIHNNTSCKMTVNNSTECPTTNPAENPLENRAEKTLSEIKSILQSVLTEVKTCSKLTSPPDLPKKDAVVQNGPSYGNIYGGAQPLQSFTNRPYDVNPDISSYSRQLPSSNYTVFPGIQAGCFQQYPLLIHPQKHMCTKCYRNNNVTKSVTIRAACAATNTDQNQERSQETEQLIKEIYKSIAMNVEIPSRTGSIGEYNKAKPTIKYCFKNAIVEKDNESENIAKAISEIFRSKNPQDSSITRYTDTTFASSKPTSNEVSLESERVIRKQGMAQRMYDYSQNVNSTSNTISRETEQMSRDVESEGCSDVTGVNEDSEDSEESTSSSETINEDVVVNIGKTTKTEEKKKEKHGIFTKMVKIFQTKHRRGRTEKMSKEVKQESESDSDDYQTIYSHKCNAPKQKKIAAVRSRPHSKVFYSKQPQLKRSRTRSPEQSARINPYMEQEYRRYWDEKLMFHENQSKRYSTTASKYTTDTPRARRPAYYQNFEARSALIDSIRQVPLRMPGNTLKASYVTNNSRYPGTNYGGNRSRITLHRPSYPGNIVTYSSNISHHGGTSLYARNKTPSPNNSNIKPHFVASKTNGQRKSMVSAKGLAWLKKHKLGLKCGPQWKELILEG